MKKHSEEFENFDNAMRGLLAVPYSELQEKLEEEKRAKAKHKKKRPTSTASSRASSSRKKRVANCHLTRVVTTSQKAFQRLLLSHFQIVCASLLP